MKKLLYIAVFSLITTAGFAQETKIDMAKAPTPIYKKSNATLLHETKERTPPAATEPNPAEQYNRDGTITNGTFRNAAPANSINMSAQPQMMNSTHHQGSIGNMKTNSATYYDNSGKIRSTNTTIKLGK